MIVLLVMIILLNIVSWITGLFPACDCLDLVEQIRAAFTGMFEAIARFWAWIPFGALFHAIPLVLCALIAALIIKVFRMVFSAISGGGGSAS